MPRTVASITHADRERLSRPNSSLNKASLIGRRIGRKCDPQPVLDARQPLAAASRTDRIDPGRVVLEDEADAIAARVLAAQVDLKRNIEGRAEIDTLRRYETSVLGRRIRSEHVAIVVGVIGSIAVALKD